MVNYIKPEMGAKINGNYGLIGPVELEGICRGIHAETVLKSEIFKAPHINNDFLITRYAGFLELPTGELVRMQGPAYIFQGRESAFEASLAMASSEMQKRISIRGTLRTKNGSTLLDVIGLKLGDAETLRYGNPDFRTEEEGWR